MRISLKPDLEAIIAEKLETGRYTDAEAVLSDALHLLQDMDEAARQKLEHLRQALRQGDADFASGNATAINGDAALQDFFARL
ncbi:type II toxin-antitoxin system ParD family antitoxin [Ferrovibrio sp.]|uniref:ribbon-helix-helix domain-containing protein n=1 Tax=Ferrovibrio sp. TaxID=1917215 RepID=UPI0025B83A9E|nr:type II toxin-antitoxin system ParD family antitoxin [Ferrovibrio sp.]MBX3456447.1 type II toxin-antitoxin system ParD family antitoxin [Ferrovibrio sp.]